MTNAEIIAQAEQVIIRTYGRYPVAFVRGQGATLWDADGNPILTFEWHCRLRARPLPSPRCGGNQATGRNPPTRLEFLPYAPTNRSRDVSIGTCLWGQIILLQQRRRGQRSGPENCAQIQS